MSQILEATAIIKGKDDTGGAFDSVASKIGRIARAANALNRDVQKQMNLASSSAANAERHIAKTQRAQTSIASGAKLAAGATAGYLGGHAISAVAHETIKASADRAHEKARMDAAGMTVDEIEDATRLAGNISKKFPSLSQTEMMHTARNVRSVVGSFEEATNVLEPLARLRVVALGAHPEKAEELEGDFDKLVKGMEIKGVTQNPEKFAHYIEGMSKAINVFGDTLRPTDYYEMFKYGRAATTALSDDYMLKTAPTLAQEMGGNSAGVAQSSFHSQFVGGKMSNKAVEMLNDLGLIDPDKVIKTKTGKIEGVKPGGVRGDGYLTPGQEDPYLWVNKVLIPAMKSKGMTSEQINAAFTDMSEPLLPKGAKEQEVIAAAASKATTAQMLGIYATQQARIEKDHALIEKAKNGASAEDFQKNDPKVWSKAIGSQAENILANATDPLMPGVNVAGNWLTSGLSWTAEHANQHPDHIINGGGWLGAMLSAYGFDKMMDLGSKFTGGSNFGASKLVGSLAPIIAVTQLASDIMDDNDVERLKRYEAGPRSRLDQLKELDDKESAAGVYGDPEFAAYVKAQTAGPRGRLEGELAGFGYNPDVTQGRYRGGNAGWSIDDIQKATGIGGGEPAKAVVEGNATLETTVKVEASPSFLASIEQKITNAINAFRASGGPATGSTGSTGQSMPEAGPSH